MELKEGKALKVQPSLKEEIVKSKEKYLEKYEELQTSLSLDSDAQIELTKFQLTMENIKSHLEKVEVIKKYWGDKVYV